MEMLTLSLRYGIWRGRRRGRSDSAKCNPHIWHRDCRHCLALQSPTNHNRLACYSCFICTTKIPLLQLEGWFGKVSLQSTATGLLWKLQHSFPTFLLNVNLKNIAFTSQLWIKNVQKVHLAFLSRPPLSHLLHLRYLNAMSSPHILALYLRVRLK